MIAYITGAINAAEHSLVQDMQIKDRSSINQLETQAAEGQQYMPQQSVAHVLLCTCITVPAVVFASALTDLF